MSEMLQVHERTPSCTDPGKMAKSCLRILHLQHDSDDCSHKEHFSIAAISSTGGMWKVSTG